MLCKTYCASCIGLSAVTVTVETDISAGIGIQIVGLPDSAVRESLTRVVTALRSYGFSVPGKRVIINLAPADIKKEGSAFDLAIGVSLLCAMEMLNPSKVGRYMLLGELALDGEVRPVTGALPIAVHARECGFEGCIFPYSSALEAVDIDEVQIFGVRTLGDVIEILKEERDVQHLRMRGGDLFSAPPSNESESAGDFINVKGQAVARRGLEIAAAGAHNVILIGSPGCGKTFMASCLPSILPPMSREESIETSKIYSVAGKSFGCKGLMKRRPFRTPHNSASRASLLGGGQNALPGEISLAHNGVLYLDEIAQFSSNTIDLLRQPVEDGRITISRARYRVDYPCAFMLVASMNPCPCGYFGDKSGRCSCSQKQVENYMNRISGPMMDRIDLHVFLSRVPAEDLVGTAPGESSRAIAARVAAARKIQLERFAGTGIFTNSGMTAAMIAQWCPLGEAEASFLEKVIEKLNLSARAYGRILKIARTIADLEGSIEITIAHLSEAVGFRGLDRYEK